MNPFEQEFFSNLPEKKVEEIYRNPAIRLPFDPQDLALFLDKAAEGSPEDLSRRLRILPYHHRSADLGVVYPMHEHLRDAAGDDVENVYLQIDIKGIGFLHPESHESKKDNLDKGSLAGSREAVFAPDSQETPMGFDVLGLMDEGMAMTTIKRSRELAAAGMRTESIAGVYRLKAIRLGGEEVSVKDFKSEAKEELKSLSKQAKEEGDEESAEEYSRKLEILNSPDGYQPVSLVRLVRSVFRLRDFKDADAETRLAMMEEVERCLNVEAKELGRSERFDLHSREGREAWLKHISEWIGEGLGIMHSKGLVHIFLHMGNMTLAGEIVDLDSVQPVVKRGKGAGKLQSDQPFFRTTSDGYAYIDPAVGQHRKPDEKFGLPKCLVKDLRDASFSMRMVLKEVWSEMDGVTPELRRELAGYFFKGYESKFGGAEPFEDIGVSGEGLRRALRGILDEVVVKGKRMAPIPADE